MSTPKDHATPITATATHATAAVASITGIAGTKFFVTEASASSDKAGAIMIVKQGTTVLWQLQMAANTSVVQRFDPALPAAVGALISCEVDGTNACKANINGYAL